MELIKLRIKQDGTQVVSARDLHAYLADGVNNNTVKWMTSNISSNEFAIEGVDYQRIHTKYDNGRTGDDFAITIDFAKRLAMMTKTAKGEEVRSYFIECEKQAKQRTVVDGRVIPHDFKSALHALVEQIEITEKVEERLLEAKPAIDFYQTTANSEGLLLFREAAKMLDIGQNRLFEICRDHKLIMHDNQPYQYYVNLGLFKVILGQRPNSKGGTSLTQTTKMTPKGLEYLHKIISNH